MPGFFRLSLWRAELVHVQTRLGCGVRPKGEVHLALLEAVKALATPDRGVSLREMAVHACVGLVAARNTLASMKRTGSLVIVRTRRVAYRNRPISEYALPPDAAPAVAPVGFALGAALSAWHASPSASTPEDPP